MTEAFPAPPVVANAPEAGCLHRVHSSSAWTYIRSLPPLSSILRSSITSLRSFAVSSFQYYRAEPQAIVREVLSGAAVAVMLVPESVAFGILGNVSPLIGLFSTFFIGLFAGALGGKPAMISGMAGALMVVAAEFMKDGGALADYTYAERFQHFLLIVLIMGVMQMVAGLCGFARLLRLVPRPVHVGFVNALAIVIFRAQLESFQVCTSKPLFFDCTKEEKQYLDIREGVTWIVLLHVALTMSIVLLFPKIKYVGKVIPSTLIALIVCTIMEHLIIRKFSDLDTRSVGETALVSGSLPSFTTPQKPASGWNLGVVFEYAFILALIGLVESLLAIQALNQVTRTPQKMPQFHQECAAQGIGNVFAALFGAVGGSILIGESAVNVLTGGKGRLSSIVSAVCVFLTVVFASPLIELIPIGSLTGILFVAIVKTFDWATFKTLPRIPITDSLIIVVVTVLGVVTDLAIAVVVGVVMASLFHAWRESRSLTLTVAAQTEEEITYDVKGDLLFATAWLFESDMIQRVDGHPNRVILDFQHSRILDYSALHAIYKIVKEHKRAGKSVWLRHVDELSVGVLKRSGKMINKGEHILLSVPQMKQEQEETMAMLDAIELGAAATDADDNDEDSAPATSASAIIQTPSAATDDVPA